jgi:hypothetical protein
MSKNYPDSFRRWIDSGYVMASNTCYRLIFEPEEDVGKTDCNHEAATEAAYGHDLSAPFSRR